MGDVDTEEAVRAAKEAYREKATPANKKRLTEAKLALREERAAARTERMEG